MSLSRCNSNSYFDMPLVRGRRWNAPDRRLCRTNYFYWRSGCTGSPTQIYRLDPSKSTLPWQVLYVLWITTSILQAQDVTCLGTQAVVPIIVAFHPTGHDVRHWVDLLAQACALQVISHAVPILLCHQAMDRLGRCFVDNRLRHQIELTLNAWGGTRYPVSANDKRI